MFKKFICVLVIFFGSTVWAEEYKTDNFQVNAPTAHQAEAIGKKAESLRKSIAELYFGKTLDKLNKKCVIDFKEGSFRFGVTTSNKNVPVQIEIIAGYDIMMEFMLPHEITHSVITQRFKTSSPRWIDEGCAVSSEPSRIRELSQKKCREYLEAGKLYRLTALFDRREYPHSLRDVEIFYAESYSITQYLIDKKGHKTFLDFAEYGMNKGWNAALKEYYKIDTVNDLEAEWTKTLKSSGLLFLKRVQ